MLVKFHCLLFIILFISSVSSRNVQLNFNRSNDNKADQSITTLAPEKIHLNINENSYSAEDKYKYINECVQKCMENRPQQPKTNSFANGRDNCIQTQCRFYQKRR